MKQINIKTEYRTLASLFAYYNFEDWEQRGCAVVNYVSKNSDPGEEKEDLERFFEECSITEPGIIETVNNLLKDTIYKKCLMKYYRVKGDGNDTLELFFCDFPN